jgi:hypothetical protein
MVFRVGAGSNAANRYLFFSVRLHGSPSFPW